MPREIEVRRCEPEFPIVTYDDMEGSEGLSLFYPAPKPGQVNHFVEPIVTALIRDIQLGLTLSDAAMRQGLKPEKVQQWYASNKGNFKNVVNKAKIDNKALHLARITEAKDGLKVKASAWMLERKHKDEYAKATEMTITPKMPPAKQVMKVGDKEYEF